eukprot:COSAG02_NODE_1146_length_14225_cov_10.142989_7_plen_65_part_00
MRFELTETPLYVRDVAAECHMGHFVAACQYRRRLRLANRVTLHEMHWGTAPNLHKARQPTVWGT